MEQHNVNIRKTICLLCGVSLAFVLACAHREQVAKPIVIVEDEQSSNDQWLSNVLTACPGVLLGFNKNSEADHYLAQLLWRNNRWSAVLWREASGEQYVISANTGPDYKTLLSDMCSRAREDEENSNSVFSSSQAQNLRYDMRDLRNGNVVTSAVLDRKTGRVWIWTTVTNDKGVKVRSEFSQEDLVPPPN